MKVLFPRTSLPDARGPSDFTHSDKLRVPIGGVLSDRLLYLFVLAFLR